MMLAREVDRDAGVDPKAAVVTAKPCAHLPEPTVTFAGKETPLGCTTSRWVRATVVDGMNYDSRTNMARDCVGDRSPAVQCLHM